MSGWRPSLRLAWRDALRSRGRSVLVLVMIALPVLAVTTADIVYRTSEVRGAESLDRRIGAADALVMQMDTRDFYVSLIGGEAFTRYASTVDTMQIDAATLNNAIRAVRTTPHPGRFELQSLLVFCVAESIRSDLIATQIEATIRASLGRLLGAAPRIAVGSMLAQARAWGQSSDAVWASLAPEVRAAFSKPQEARTPAERRLYERIDETRIDPALKLTARGVKVLKRPG